MFQSKLAELMEKKGATVHGLADLAGVSSRTIMRARGDLIGRCTLDTLGTIAAALGARTKDLYKEV
ncbi:helix-turn-helix domain-containing protein [Desulfovibrio aerotolerans]|uniref:Helix-turn-helix domain-containing protein n=1 Tax=Solidesulfovibrio aerotolerans TaxID=295255 RepID=A0A7C9MXE6_9BACT|nr:helix-turn-helix transcriptional regulator [Solidesulfovibrio aerotolerans]MYL85254.1 helix-turn-helix domain-containing protein [Solidesulfovibrio aerotolerans]